MALPGEARQDVHVVTERGDRWSGRDDIRADPPEPCVWRDLTRDDQYPHDQMSPSTSASQSAVSWSFVIDSVENGQLHRSGSPPQRTGRIGHPAPGPDGADHKTHPCRRPTADASAASSRSGPHPTSTNSSRSPCRKPTRYTMPFGSSALRNRAAPYRCPERSSTRQRSATGDHAVVSLGVDSAT